MAPLRTRIGLTVCLIGPECTGKTTLAQRLADHFRAPWVPEFAREYAQRVGRPLTADDVEPIARGQMALEDGAPWDRGRPARRSRADETSSPPRLIILDTDLISTVVYSRHYYGHCPEWIEQEARARKSNLYLLLDIDVPWTTDDVRDSSATRETLHSEFAATLTELDAEVVPIRGDREARFATAAGAIGKRASRT